MELTIINGPLVIGEVSVESMSISSVFMAGDLKRISLVSCLETPLEHDPSGAERRHDPACP